jgi:hypothetical protein
LEEAGIEQFNRIGLLNFMTTDDEQTFFNLNVSGVNLLPDKE